MKSINYLALVEVLLDRTAKREVNWLKVRDEEYKILLKSGAVTISKYWIVNENHYRIVFRIYNNNGDNIFEYGCDPDDLIDAENPNALYYKILDELYVSARSAFFKVEETIENLFSEIADRQEIGSKELPPKDPDDLSDLPF